MVGGFLCCAGGDHQQLGIIVELAEPVLDVERVTITTSLGRQAEHVACDGGGDLSYQFLSGIRLITEAPAHVTSETILVPSPVSQLM